MSVDIRRRIIEAIMVLEDYPSSLRHLDVEKMRGRESTFRVRVGDFRLIFYVDKAEGVVYVTTLGRRGRVYKG